MNPYCEDVTCDLCGGPGAATVRGSTSRWFGGKLYHKDPGVCEHYLEQARKKATQAAAQRLDWMLERV